MPKTLLEKAKEADVTSKNYTATPEEVELALGWLVGEIRLTQVSNAIEKSSISSAYIFLCRALRKAYQDGKLIIK